jgi:hypothetical protein
MGFAPGDYGDDIGTFGTKKCVRLGLRRGDLRTLAGTMEDREKRQQTNR